MKRPEDAIKKLRALRRLKAHAELREHLDVLLKYVDRLEKKANAKPEPQRRLPKGYEDKLVIRIPEGLSWTGYGGILSMAQRFVNERCTDLSVTRLSPVFYTWRGVGLPLYTKCYWMSDGTAHITASRSPWAQSQTEETS